MSEKPEGTPNPLNPVQGIQGNDQKSEPEQTIPVTEQPAVDAKQPVAEVEQQSSKVDEVVPETKPAEAEQQNNVSVDEAPAKEEQPSETEKQSDVKQPMPEPMENEPVPVAIKINVTEETIRSETVAPESVASETVTPEPTVSEIVTPEPVANTVTGTTASVAPVRRKSNKAGLIVGVIFLLIAVIAGVAAAIIMLNPFKGGDAVPAAITKLLNGDAPDKVTLSGKIEVNSDNDEFLFNSLAVNMNGGMNNSTNESYANAKVSAVLSDGGTFSFGLDEIHSADGNYYLRLSDVYSELVSYYDAQGMTVSDEPQNTDCYNGPEGTDNCVQPLQPASSLFSFVNVFDVIDDEWVMIPDTGLSNITEMVNINSTSQCLIGAAGKLGQYDSGFVDKYNQNPFINYSTDGIKMPVANSSIKNQVYHLTFDADKLARFINSMQNSGFMNELQSCMGGLATNTDVSGKDLSEIIKTLPEIDVQIDDNNNFKRIYMSMYNQDAKANLVADLEFNYPSSIDIKTPTIYLDYNQALMKILSQFTMEEMPLVLE